MVVSFEAVLKNQAFHETFRPGKPAQRAPFWFDFLKESV